MGRSKLRRVRKAEASLHPLLSIGILSGMGEHLPGVYPGHQHLPIKVKVMKKRA